MIDIHTHDYPDAYREAVCDPASGLEHYVRDDGRIVVLQDGAVSLAMPQPLPTVAERLAVMDAAGVRLQALSVSAPNVYRMPRDMRMKSAARSTTCSSPRLDSITSGSGHSPAFRCQTSTTLSRSWSGCGLNPR